MDATLEDVELVHRAILLASLDSVDKPPHFLSVPIATAVSRTSRQLRIVLYSPLFSTENPERPEVAVGTKRWDAVQSTLTFLYVEAMKVAQETGKILMDVDVLLKGAHEPLQDTIIKDAEVVYRGASHLKPASC